MLKDLLLESYDRMPHKLLIFAARPLHAGRVLREAKNGFLSVEGISEGDGQKVCFQLLIDESDGCFADLRYQIIGDSRLLGLAEALCGYLSRKHAFTLKKLTQDLVVSLVSSGEKKPSLLLRAALLIEALDRASEKIGDLSQPEKEVFTPEVAGSDEALWTPAYPNWLELSDLKRVEILKAFLQREIAPYLSLDGGALELVELRHGIEVVIGYSGNCSSCYASVGSTLSAILRMVRAKIYPHLTVTPDPSFLHLGEGASNRQTPIPENHPKE